MPRPDNPRERSQRGNFLWSRLSYSDSVLSRVETALIHHHVSVLMIDLESGPSGPGIPRKEVIQPHLPVRLPCYDFTPVTWPTFDSCHCWPTGFGCSTLPWCDGRCVQDPGTYSPPYADRRLLATPPSCRRVAACNPN